MEYYSAIKNNEIMSFAANRMDLQVNGCFLTYDDAPWLDDKLPV